MSRSLLNIDKLKNRLSKILFEQIAAELSSLIDEIEIKSNVCRSRLNKFENFRIILTKQQLYLFHFNQLFQSLIKFAVNDTYNDSFFEDAKSEFDYQKRIQTVMQNLNLNFANEIVRRDHYREVIDSKNTNHIFTDVVSITKNEFIDYVQHLMRRTKDRKLPKIFNSMIVSNLFLKQSVF